MSLVEVMVFGAVAVMVLVVVMGLLTNALRRDTSSAGRIDRVATLALVIDRLRGDAQTATGAEAGTSDELVVFRTYDARDPARVKPVAYRFRGAAVARDGEKIGRGAVKSAGVEVRPGLVTVDVAVGGARVDEPLTVLKVPLLVRRAALEERFPIWVERPADLP